MRLFNFLCYYAYYILKGVFMSVLTKREKEIFELLVKNKTTSEIGEILFISEKTVRNHISNVIGKLGVVGRSQAIIELIRMEEISL